MQNILKKGAKLMLFTVLALVAFLVSIVVGTRNNGVASTSSGMSIAHADLPGGSTGSTGCTSGGDGSTGSSGSEGSEGSGSEGSEGSGGSEGSEGSG